MAEPALPDRGSVLTRHAWLIAEHRRRTATRRARGTGRLQRARTVIAWVLLVGSLIGWPVSMATFAAGEPPFVLSLSWLAIVIEAGSLLTASQLHEKD